VAYFESGVILGLEEEVRPNSHAEMLPLFCERLILRFGKPDALAINCGPGSYTGLRIGVSLAKGMAMGYHIPVILVPGLEALAESFSAQDAFFDFVIPCSDARRMEVYCGLFDGNGIPVSQTAAKIIDNKSFGSYFERGQTIIFSGNGAAKCMDTITSPFAIFHPSECSAAHLPSQSCTHFENKKFGDIAYFTPLYLKPPNITIPKIKSLIKA